MIRRMSEEKTLVAPSDGKLRAIREAREHFSGTTTFTPHESQSIRGIREPFSETNTFTPNKLEGLLENLRVAELVEEATIQERAKRANRRAAAQDHTAVSDSPTHRLAPSSLEKTDASCPLLERGWYLSRCRPMTR